MPTIKIDKFTTLPAPVELHESKYYWELFPYDAEIDMADWTYGGQPMSEEQKSFIEEYRTGLEDVLEYDKELSNRILMNTMDRLTKHGVQIDSEYKDLLNRMAMVMSASSSMKCPMVITSRPGLGKTQMLIASLVEKIKSDTTYTAIVVTNRIENAVNIAEAVNDQSGTDSCWVRPSFSLETKDGRCRNGFTSKDFKINICRKENCTKSECSVKTAAADFRKHKVVLISSRYLNIKMDNGELQKLMTLSEVDFANEDGSLHYLFNGNEDTDEMIIYRRELIIDENPGTVFTGEVSNQMLNDCFVHLKQNDFKDHLIDEFQTVRMYVSGQFGGISKYEHTDSTGHGRRLSDEFVNAWYKTPPKKNYNMPYVINRLLENGGIRQNSSGKYEYLIGVEKYRGFADLAFQITVLDGTGIRDQTYRQDEFYILDIPEIRDMSRGTIHWYSRNLSKSFLDEKGKKKSRLDALSDEAIRVLGDESSLLITNLHFEKDIQKRLEDNPNIKINHFGNLIGSNDYVNSKIIFFAGLHEWRPIDYFRSTEAVSGTEVELEFDLNQKPHYVDPVVHEFRASQIALGLYQDLMRSNLREPGSEESVEIYIWTEDEGIQHRLQSWLPGINVKIAKVPDPLRGERHSTQLSSEAKFLLDELKSTLTEAELNAGPTRQAQILAECLNYAPQKIEVEYLFGKVNESNFHRLTKSANTYLKSKHKGMSAQTKSR
jgi:hypothetical protein